MKKPYIKAFVIPWAFVFDDFVKNVTVIGIIGNTQGVSKATKPDKNAPNKKNNKAETPLSFFLSSSKRLTTISLQPARLGISHATPTPFAPPSLPQFIFVFNFANSPEI